VIAEYLALGKMRWSAAHARDLRAYLYWWLDVLGFELLADVDGCMPKVEKVLQAVEATGRPDKRPGHEGKVRRLSGRSMQALADALKSFFNWCALPARRYLTANPLDGMAKFDRTPRILRRALALAEIQALRDACVEEWERMLLETALCAGLRKGELRAATIDHLDVERATLRVDAHVSKNRKLSYQPIPEKLARDLAAFYASGTPARLYARHYARKNAKTTASIPERPLLFVPASAAKFAQTLARRAGILRIDFHTLRTAYINLLLDSGTDAKTVQQMARHHSPSLTMNTYGRAKVERMVSAVAVIGAAVLGPSGDAAAAPAV
jgi:integrase